MKYVSIVFILLFSFINAQSQVNLKVNVIEVSFSSNLNFEDLADIKDQLTKLNINLTYQSLVFREDGQLKNITFKVDCNDGFNGSAGGKLFKNNKIGFYRDYTLNAASPFGTGSPHAD